MVKRAAGPPYRILYLQSTSEIGGSDLALLRTIQHLDKKVFQPHVVLPHDGPLVHHFRQAGAEIHFVPMAKATLRRRPTYFAHYAIRYLPTVWTILRLIDGNAINLVHTNSLHNLYGWLAALLSGRPHVWHIRELVTQSAVIRKIELFLARRFSTRIIVMSSAIGEMFGSVDTLPPHFIKLHDGIELDTFRPGISSMRIRAALRWRGPLVGAVSRLDEWKGLDTFLRAAAEVKSVMPNTRFLVAGGAIEGQENYEIALKQLAQRLGLGDCVYFTGWKYAHEDIPEVLNALDLFVLVPNTPEPYGLAVLEAMACGTPSVLSNTGGPREIVGNSGCATLVPPRDPASTACAIVHLLQDDASRRAMSTAARRRAEADFDVRHCVRRLESLYLDLLEA